MSAKVARRQIPDRAATAAAASSSLRDTAYEAIKHSIITCALKPGEYVNEAQLCVTFGIGRTPVHQALDRLMHDGLVQVIPRRGVIVKPVSLDEVMQIIDVRLLNETYCARLAAERADQAHIEEMADILARARTAGRNVKQLMELDREFHATLARAAANDVLSELLGRLHERALRFWFISLNAPEHHVKVQDEHEAILAAVKKRNGAAAEAAMRRHIESFRRNVARYL